VHVNALIESPGMLRDYQILLVPGGFSYGDDVAAGKILAAQFCQHLGEPLRAFRDAGKLIFGVCNGFQVLAKAGLLPGLGGDGRENGSSTLDTSALDPSPSTLDPLAGQRQQITLAYNDSGRFECRWIHLRAEPGRCVFLQGVERLDLPIAHGEGKFVCRDDTILTRLASGRQLVLRYAIPGAAEPDSCGGTAEPPGATTPALPYPVNPNGSQANVAGICDPTGRVFGLMPHPERFVDAVQHPHWTRRRAQGEGDGLALFRNAVHFFAA
jgi:phosphoribosylformylglycinamidine synthase